MNGVREKSVDFSVGDLDGAGGNESGETVSENGNLEMKMPLGFGIKATKLCAVLDKGSVGSILVDESFEIMIRAGHKKMLEIARIVTSEADISKPHSLVGLRRLGTFVHIVKVNLIHCVEGGSFQLVHCGKIIENGLDGAIQLLGEAARGETIERLSLGDFERDMDNIGFLNFSHERHFWLLVEV